MEEIDQKLNRVFAGRVVRKDLSKKIKEGINVPIYVSYFRKGENTYVFVENYSPEASVSLKHKTTMTNMLSGAEEDVCVLGPYGFAVYKSI